jgi:hypothetical protein
VTKRTAKTSKENGKDIPMVSGRNIGFRLTRNCANRKARQDRRLQLEGFVRCLEIWLRKQCPRLRLANVVDYSEIERLTKDIELEDLPKWFKFQLADNFSRLTGQERPEGPRDWVNRIEVFFTSGAKPFVCRNLRSTGSRKKRLTFLWNLLQCKTASNPVPQTFIKAGYTKHWKTMQSEPAKVDPKLLEELSAFIDPWIQALVAEYTDRTKMPKQHATVTTGRGAGGMKKDLAANLKPMTYLTWDGQRFEPVVIHLEGRPGVGKSRMVERLSQEIGKAFGMTGDFKTWTYYRSAATKHWDGYRNQLISVVDDLGFEAASCRSGPSTSCDELLQLVSDCDYLLPMAELRDKGKNFTSPFIIITSNQATQYNGVSTQFACPAAFLRRLSPTWCMTDHGIFKKVFNMTTNPNPPYDLSHVSWDLDSSLKLDVHDIAYDALRRFQMKDKGPVKWIQPIMDAEEYHPGMSLIWDVVGLPLVNRVGVFAIPEPLKVRTITKPEPLSYGLKPLQLAMMEALKRFPCFEPCHNPNYGMDLIGSLLPGNKYISGDYTAATDDLNFLVSQLVVHRIADRFKDRPELRDLILWEGGHHVVSYPPWTELPDVLQKNGQLMGSLLSFPILCLINAFTVARAKGLTLKDLDVLIHGDDLGGQMSRAEFQKWKKTAKQVGLSLSVGKNYFTEDFLSIDSRLYVRNKKTGFLERQVTGKFKLLYRKEGEGLTCAEALRNGFSKDLIRRYCAEGLKETCRSLDIAECLGGLGLVTNPDYEWSKIDKAVYDVMSYDKTTVQSLGNGFYRCLDFMSQVLNRPEILIPEEKAKTVTDDKLKKKVTAYLKKVGTPPEVKRNGNLRKLRHTIIHCDNSSRGYIQMIQDRFTQCNHGPYRTEENSGFPIERTVRGRRISKPLVPTLASLAKKVFRGEVSRRALLSIIPQNPVEG